ncbi:MAG: hypothetical protein IT392_04340 [Nitrospirae bacterium]|nr:hypothetical protein [Nitrospirota bacterium]
MVHFNPLKNIFGFGGNYSGKLFLCSLFLFVYSMIRITQVLAGDDALGLRSLRGLKGIRVVVEGLEPEAEKDGLIREQIRNDVELRLHKAGIKVYTKDEFPTATGIPSLDVNVTAKKHNETSLYYYNISVNLFQRVALIRDPDINGFGTTWFTGWVGAVSSRRIRNVRVHINDCVDEFISDYLIANPGPPVRPNEPE